MASSKLSADTGAQNLIDTIGCKIIGTLHVDKKKFKLFKDRSTRCLILSNRLQRTNVCGLYCFENIYATKAEFAFWTSELQSAKTYETSDKKGYGLLIIFEEADIPPLKFVCAGRKESEEWVEKINEAINQDKKFSQDSAYGSGGSFTGEQLKKKSAVDIENHEQQTGGYHEINEEAMDQTHKCTDAKYTLGKERAISEKRIPSRDSKQTAKAGMHDNTADYENAEEQSYLNGNLGKQNYDSDDTHRKERVIPENRPHSRDAKQTATATTHDETTFVYETFEECSLNDNVEKQKDGKQSTAIKEDSDHTRRKERFTLEKRIPSREIKHNAKAGMQDVTDIYENLEDQKIGKQKYGVPETGTNVMPQPLFNTSDTTTQGNVKATLLAREALAEFEGRKKRPQKKQDTPPSINEQSNTRGKTSPPTLLKKEVSREHLQQTSSYTANDQDASFISVREGIVCHSTESYLSVESAESVAVRSIGVNEEALYENGQCNEPIYENSSRSSEINDEIFTGNPVESSDEDSEPLSPDDYMCQNKEDAKRMLNGKPPGTFAIYKVNSSLMTIVVLDDSSRTTFYKIYYQDGKYKITPKSKYVFDTIDKLVEFYIVTDLPKLQNEESKIKLAKGWNSKA